jgi:hypothetical protein
LYAEKTFSIYVVGVALIASLTPLREILPSDLNFAVTGAWTGVR